MVASPLPFLLLCAGLGLVACQEYKIVCYFISWSFYRRDEANFQPENIDPSLCTHIHYAYAHLDAETLLVKPMNAHLDIQSQFYERVVALKETQPDLKVLLALGGWGDSEGDKYSRMVSSPQNRQAFITDLIKYLKEHRFDGLELDWQFPKCWQFRCDLGPDSDKQNFGALLRELRAAFDREQDRLLLAVNVGFNFDVAEKAYDAAAMNEAADYVSVQAYDMHGFWESFTGHMASMYFRRGDNANFYNVDKAMQYWAQKGICKTKLLMGLAAFGRTYTLKDARRNNIGDGAVGGGKPSEYIGEDAMVPFLEVCQNVKSNNWTVKRDPKAGPYAFKGDQWVSFDDPVAFERKAKYVQKKGYGGVRVFEVASDDFFPLCCQVKFPLLTTLNYVLTQPQLLPPSKLGCW